jgi:hypothetical protein
VHPLVKTKKKKDFDNITMHGTTIGERKRKKEKQKQKKRKKQITFHQVEVALFRAQTRI